MPNTREKLIELLNEAEEYEVNTCMFHSECEDCPGRKYGDNCRDCLKADHLIANGVTLANQVASSSKQLASSKWIPVTERLPEESGDYLVITYNGFIERLSYSERHNAFNTDDRLMSAASAIPCTHWMPLPEPPKGE